MQTHTSNLRQISLLLLAVAACFASAQTIYAANGNWNVDAAGNWSLNTNWSSNPTVPGTTAGDVIGLNNNITVARIVTIDSTSRTAGTLNIGDSTSSFFGFTLAANGGAGLTFNNSGAGAAINKPVSTATDSITAPITVSDAGGLAITVNAGTLNITGGLNNGGNLLTIGGTGNTSFAGTANNISGAGGITKNGSGFLTLAAGGTNPNHSYTGPTTINGGTVLIFSNKSSGNFTLNGGMLTDYFQTNFSFTGGLGTGINQIQIYGDSGFGAGNGTSQWTIGGANSVLTWGSANFNPTTLKFFAPGVDNMGPSIYGVVQLNNGLNLGGASRTIDVAAASGANAIANSRAIITGVISNGTLTKTGNGNLQLNGANTYAGGTAINFGMVRFNGKTTMPNAGTVSVSSGATLGVLVNNGGTGWGGGAGNGGIAGLTNGLGGQAGSTVSFAGNSSLFLDVAADTIESNVVSNGGATNLSLIKFGANTLTLSNNNTFTGSVIVGAGTLTMSGNNTFSSATVNAGTLVLSGDNAMTGATTVNGGALTLAHVNAIDTSSSLALATGTTLNLRNNTAASFNTPLTTLATTGTSSATIDVNNNGAGTNNTLTLSGGIFSNQVHGNVTTLNFTGGNGYLLNIPTLSVNRNGGGGAGGGTTLNPTTTSVAIGPTSVTASQTLLFTLAGSTAGNSIGGISQVGGAAVSLTKSGTSTWTINGLSSYTGTTAVQTGTLIAGANGVFGSAASDISLGVAGGNSDAAILIGGGFTVARNIRLLTSDVSDAGTRVLTLGGNTAHNSIFSGNVILGSANFAGRGVTLTAASGGQVTFSGVIQNPSGMDATNYAVTKSGLGTVILTNANTYSGTTIVNDGTLLVNNVSGSGTGTGNVTVNSAGTIGGTGRIAGNVTGAGDIAPGLSPGEITIDGSFDMSGNYLWELGAHQDDTTGTAGVHWDLISAGTADLDGLTLDLAFILTSTLPDSGNPFWNTDHTWLIVDSNTAVLGNFTAITYQGGPVAFDSGTFATFVDGNQAFLQFTSAAAVPEPASLVLWSLLGLSLFGWAGARLALAAGLTNAAR